MDYEVILLVFLMLIFVSYLKRLLNEVVFFVIYLFEYFLYQVLKLKKLFY